jgi:hypothetical protein
VICSVWWAEASVLACVGVRPGLQSSTPLAFRPSSPETQLKVLKPEPGQPRSGMTAFLPTDIWSSPDLSTRTPWQYVSPDGSAFIPASDAYVSALDRCWNTRDGLKLHLIAANGSRETLSGPVSCHPLPPSSDDVYQFIRLEPETFYGQIMGFELKWLLRKPGHYQFQVTYSPFLSRDWVDKYMANGPIASLPLWTAEEPTLKSDPFWVTITP